MDRLIWLLLALVLVLVGVYLHLRLASEWLAFLVAGIGPASASPWLAA